MMVEKWKRTLGGDVMRGAVNRQTARVTEWRDGHCIRTRGRQGTSGEAESELLSGHDGVH